MGTTCLGGSERQPSALAIRISGTNLNIAKYGKFKSVSVPKSRL